MLTRYDDDISIIDTMALGLPRLVAAYLIRGKETALIDMGYASSYEIVRADVENNSAGSGGINHLLPTHVHLDHSGSCSALAEYFPGASVRVHPLGEGHLVDPSKLWAVAAELFGGELMKRYGKPKPIKSTRLRSIGDDEIINLGRGLVLRSIWTPGHASHHLSYVLEGTGIVFTGDAVGITYPDFPVLIPTTPPTSFILEYAIQSLRRIEQTRARRLLTPHFGVLHDAANIIDANIRSLQGWTAKISSMLKKGQSTGSIIRMLTRDIADEGGRPLESIPAYVKLSIRVSAMGVIRYLTQTNEEGPQNLP